MKRTVLLIILSAFFNSNYIQAAKVTWIGATNGSWFANSNWDTGSKPTANDDAIIDSGIVFIPEGLFAYAKSVTIGDMATLKVGDGFSGSTTLFIANSTDEGIYLEGTLIIDEGDAIRISNTQGCAITCFNEITNNGIIEINNVNDYGVLNNGDFFNEGDLSIHSSNNIVGIYNNGLFDIRGNIEIFDLTGSNSKGIFNSSEVVVKDTLSIANLANYGIENTASIFSVWPDGVLNIEDTNGPAILNTGTSTLFSIGGKVIIYNAFPTDSHSIINDPGVTISVNNFATLSITKNDNENWFAILNEGFFTTSGNTILNSHGILNRSEASFINADANLNIIGGIQGVVNEGFFENGESLSMFNTKYGIINDGQFNNVLNARININSTSDKGITNRGHHITSAI